MGILTREEILQADDLKTEIVNVPEWGGEVIVRTMTGTDRDIWDNLMFRKGERNYLNDNRAKLCSCTIVDEHGNLLFTEDDVIELGKKSSMALNRVFDVAKRLNGLGPDDVKEMAKNSYETPDEYSG